MRAFYHLRMRPLEAKRIGAVLIASLFIAFIPISIPNAQADGCHDYPASVTPECVAQNLEEARLQTIAREEAARVEALAVIARAEAQRLADAQVNAARDSSYGATVQGCRDYPKSTTPECAAQNLEVERLASIDSAAKAKQEEANVNARAEAQRLTDSETATFVIENLRIKKVVSCFKGNKIRTVTAWKPTCPEGYKKKGLTKNA